MQVKNNPLCLTSLNASRPCAFGVLHTLDSRQTPAVKPVDVGKSSVLHRGQKGDSIVLCGFGG